VISVTSHDTGSDARNIARPMAVVPIKKGHLWNAGSLSQVRAARQRLNEATLEERHTPAESGSWSGRQSQQPAMKGVWESKRLLTWWQMGKSKKDSTYGGRSTMSGFDE